MRLIDIVIICVAIASILILILDNLYENKNVACLFHRGYHIFHTGRRLYSFAIIKVKVGNGVCAATLTNHYTHKLEKAIMVGSHLTKFFVVLGKKQYYSLEIEEGTDFVVTIISFEKKKVYKTK